MPAGPAVNAILRVNGPATWDNASAQQFYVMAEASADAVLILATACLGGVGHHLYFHGGMGPVGAFAASGFFVAVLAIGFGRVLFADRPLFAATAMARFGRGGVAWTLAFGLLLSARIWLGAVNDGAHELSAYLVGLSVVGLWRIYAPSALARLALRTGCLDRDCIVIGDHCDASVPAVADRFARSGSATVIRFDGGCSDQGWPAELRGLAATATGVARELGRGDVVICAAGLDRHRLSALTAALSILPRGLRVIPDSDMAWFLRSTGAAVDTDGSIEVRREPLDFTQRILKRTLDIAASAMALVLLSPLLLTVAAAIKLESHGPVFFRQSRNGYRGRRFRIFKFRSMNVMQDGADAAKQATRNDPRVTRVGKFIRHHSIDELPQLLNILIGDMSLVGPRPHPVALDEFYKHLIANYEVRQHIKPGLTGWAQVNGYRGETASNDLMARRVEHDLWYAANASALLDCKIIVRTALEVVLPHNAY